MSLSRPLIGCSRLAAVFNAHPFVSAYRLWAELTCRIEPQRGIYTVGGNLYESVVRAAYLEDRPGVTWDGSRADYRDEPLVHEWAPLSGHPDGIITRGSSRRTVGDTKWFVARGLSGTREVPAYVEYQLRGYMALTGCETGECIVVWSMEEDGNEVCNVELAVSAYSRDLEIEEFLLRSTSEWYEAHVVADVAPEATARDLDILRKADANDGEAVLLSAEWTDSVLEWMMLLRALKDARRVVREVQAEAQAIESRLRQAMGSALRARVPQTDIVIERRITKCRDILRFTEGP